MDIGTRRKFHIEKSSGEKIICLEKHSFVGIETRPLLIESSVEKNRFWHPGADTFYLAPRSSIPKYLGQLLPIDFLLIRFPLGNVQCPFPSSSSSALLGKVLLVSSTRFFFPLSLSFSSMFE